MHTRFSSIVQWLAVRGPAVLLGVLVAWSTWGAAVAQPVTNDVIPFRGAPDDVAGFPLHRNYTPEDYGTDLYSQNWAVTQDAHGIIYAANPGGVLAFDGSAWRLIPTEKQTLVRTLVRDDDARIFVGAYGEFGHLAPDSSGTQRFVSLIDHVAEDERDFGHVWSGAATSDGVYFQTRRALFRWDGTSVTSWHTSDSTRFFRAFSVRDTLYVAQENVGLLTMTDDALQLVPNGERFARTRPTVVLPYGKRSLLVGTTASELFVRQGGDFQRFRTDADAFLTQNELYDAVQLPDGSYAFGTLWGGVVITDAQGRAVRVLNESTGIVDDDVKGLFVDRQGSLWMACEQGIARADVLLPLSLYDERAGLDGAALSLIRHERTLYVGTSSGVYRLERAVQSGGGVRPRFVRHSSLRSQVFDLLSTPWGLLAATDRGVFAFDETSGEAPRAVAVGDNRTAFGLYRSRSEPSRIFAGYIDGIRLIDAPTGRTGWTINRPIAGLDKGIFFMEEDATGTLWVSSAYSGLWRIDQPTSDAPVVEEVASEGQTPQHVFRLAFLPDRNALHVVSRDGIARPERAQNGRTRLVPDSTVTRHLPSGAGRILNVEVAPDGDLWVFTSHATYLLDYRSNGEVALSTPYAPISDVNAYAALAEPQRGFWIAGETGLIHHDPHRAYPSGPSLSTLIRRVSVMEMDSVLYGGTPDPGGTVDASTLIGPGVERSTRPALASSFTGIRFEFAAPAFIGTESDVEYRYRLDGFEDQWSVWSSDAKKEYTSLPPGRYTFHVEARHPRVWTASPTTYAFTVYPPWYRTFWAYGLYAILGVALVAGLVQWRTAHLAQRKARLEALVAERTAEVKNQSQQLQTYNRELLRSNEELQEVIEEKSKLLGVAAHDLKNPLFGMRALSEVILQRDDVPDAISRKIDLIRQSADETLALINDLLASAASTAEFNLRMETVDVAALVEWVVHGYRPQAERKNQMLTCNVPPELCFIKGDPRKLREAMNNLISNAIKYSPHNAPVEVTLTDYENEVHFTVRDRGPGLSPEDQQRLFQPFQRLTPTPTGDEPSSGLGLYIVKQIAEMHDGTVNVTSQVGKGSTFRLILPVHGSQSEDEIDDPRIFGASGDSTSTSDADVSPLSPGEPASQDAPRGAKEAEDATGTGDDSAEVKEEKVA